LVKFGRAETGSKKKANHKNKRGKMVTSETRMKKSVFGKSG